MYLLVEHLPAALLAGFAGFALSGNYWCIASALFFGWMIDGDHLFDLFYAIYHGEKPTLQSLKTGAYFKANQKVFVPLHAWEWTALLLIAGCYFIDYRAILFSGAAAHAAHLLKDQQSYRVRPLGYSLISRALSNFTLTGFCKGSAHAG